MVPNASSRFRTIFRLLLVTAAGAACGSEPPLGDVDVALSAAYKAKIMKGALLITGSGASSRLALRLQTADILDVDVGDDGSADFSFDRARFDRIVIDAGGGDDVVRMDESNGAFTIEEQVTIMGGSGDDTLLGGLGAELIFGGPGADFVDGNRGTDVVFLGDGDDTFQWDPGDESDVVEGEGGNDLMLFNGANVGEKVELAAAGTRLSFTRDIAAIHMDVDGVERVLFTARGGADSVKVDDLTGTAVARVDVDLGALPGTTVGDGLADVVELAGVPATRTVVAGADGDAVVARGSGAEVRVFDGEAVLDRLTVSGGAQLTVTGSAGDDTLSLIDDLGKVAVLSPQLEVIVEENGTARLVVDGLAGDDHITASHGLAAVPLELDGGDGDDVIVGGDAADLLLGGAGNDTIDGGFGADSAFLGDGDDTFVWNPGGGSDVVEGQGGADRLQFFGSNAAEEIALGASGGRLRLTRDIGAIVMDVDGCERVEVLARGSADLVRVADLAGTAVARVEVNLEAIPGGGGAGDGAGDEVVVEGAAQANPIEVAADGAAVVARGLGAEVAVTGGEPTLDRMTVNADRLDVDGSDGADDMALFDVGGKIGVAVTGFDVFVATGATGKLAVRGLGGDDRITANHALADIPLELDGGDGNDVILGGDRAELLLGGAGNDVIDGGFGADTAFLGDGDDTFVWNPGGGSDVVEGEAGSDVLRFEGSNAGEKIDLLASGGRLRLARDVGGVIMDVAGVEGVDVDARGGVDSVTIADLASTQVTRVGVDLAAIPGTLLGDGLVDAVTVLGTADADRIAIAADGGAAVVSGLAATVRVSEPEPGDQLIVNGAGGVDTFAADPAVQGLILLTILQD